MKTSSKVLQRDVSVTALEPKDLYTLEEAAFVLERLDPKWLAS